MSDERNPTTPAWRLEEKLAQLEEEVSCLLAERRSIDRQRKDLKQQMEKIYRVGAARMVWEADRLRNQRRSMIQLGEHENHGR